MTAETVASPPRVSDVEMTTSAHLASDPGATRTISGGDSGGIGMVRHACRVPTTAAEQALALFGHALC